MNRRIEEEALRAGLAALRNQDVAADMDFTEEEWAAAIHKAVSRRPEEEKRPARPAFRPVFAYGLAVLLVGAAVLFGVRRFPWLVPAVETRPAGAVFASAEGRTGQPEIIRPIDPLVDPAKLYVQTQNASSTKQAAGDVPTLTWISQETGLKIVWFVNDDITMED